jgi:type I restriction-modification system DNA methylase subunit
LKEYYAHITGIEKEYRLSKVSKVSAFMYGHDETNIIYADALASQTSIKEDSFDILIANPPYSVKGFLETLAESQQKHYSLFNENINIGKNNAIEAFFIERAAQLLKAGGVAGIILPVSVLNKGGIYAQAREIILQQFDIVALVEFGSGTFGKTGTNTVTMFLRRKETNTPDAEHYRNRVESWFNRHHEGDETYEDEDLLAEYCTHCGYDLEDYLSFLSGDVSDGFMQNELIQTYKDSFFGNQRNAMKGVCDKAKEIRTRFRNRQNTQAYRRLPEDEKKELEQKAFMQYVTEIEKEKVYYFILAKTIPNPVVIVKSPSGTTNMKRFLGYEWSDSKGNEGIKYLNVVSQNNDDDDGNGEDDDTLQQIKGIKGIQTPLFNPQSLEDPLKINSIIRQNFTDDDVTIPDELSEYVESFNLVDLIDFKRTDFTKAIKTTPILSYPKIESKYTSERLGIIAPYVSEKNPYTSITPSDYVTTANMLQNRGGVEPYDGVPEVGNITKYQKGDILVSNIRPYLKKIWFADHDGGCSNDVLVYRNAKPSEYLSEYLYTILSSDIFFDYMMVGKTGLKMPRGDKKIIPNFLIPVAPNDIQKIIVRECRILDKQQKECIQTVEQGLRNIHAIVNSLTGTRKKVSMVCDINQTTITPTEFPDKEYIYIDIDAVENGTGRISWNKRIKGSKAPSRAKRYAVQGSTLVSTVRPNLRGFAFVDIEYQDAVYSTGFAILKSKNQVVLPDKLVYYQFMFSDFMMKQMVDAMPQGSYPSINRGDFDTFDIITSINNQEQVLRELDEMEEKVNKAIDLLMQIPLRKQEILDKYLK